MEKTAGEIMLLDTNIFVDHLRNYTPSVEFFDTLENALFSAITEAELLAGKQNESDEKREKLLHFLHRWTKIEVTNPISVLAGDISRKHGMDIPDAIIAASALINNAVLVTRNVKDFHDIKDLKLQVPY